MRTACRSKPQPGLCLERVVNHSSLCPRSTAKLPFRKTSQPVNLKTAACMCAWDTTHLERGMCFASSCHPGCSGSSRAFATACGPTPQSAVCQTSSTSHA